MLKFFLILLKFVTGVFPLWLLQFFLFGVVVPSIAITNNSFYGAIFKRNGFPPLTKFILIIMDKIIAAIYFNFNYF